MRRHNRLAIAIALAFFAASVSTALAGPEGPGAEPPQSRQETVSRRVRITWDPATLTLDTKRIVHLLANPTKSPLLRKEIRKYTRGGASLRTVRFEPIFQAVGAPESGLLLGEYTLSLVVTDKDKPVIQLLEALVHQVGDMLKLGIIVRERRLYAQMQDVKVARALAGKRADRVKAELAKIRGTVLEHQALLRKLDGHRASIAELERQLRQSGIERDAKTARLTAVRSQMAEIAAGAVAKAAEGARAKSVAELKRRFTETEQKLEAARCEKRDEHPELQALNLALDSLEAHLARAATNLGQAATDPVAAELEKLVEAREKILALTVALQKRGKPSDSERRQAEADRLQAEAALAEAKVQLARRRAQLSRSGQASELLIKLKHEQVALMIDLREMAARRDALTKLLRQTEAAGKGLSSIRHRVADLTMRLEQIKAVELPQATKEYQQADARYESLNRQMAVLVRSPPRAIVEAPKKPKK